VAGLVFPLQNFIVVPYKGTPGAVNVAILTTGPTVDNRGQILKQNRQSQVVNTVYDWLNDYPGQGVIVNLQSQQTAGGVIDQLLMVYVDNALNSSEVTIYFPDSQMFVAVPPFTAGYYPVFTNMLICQIFNGTTGRVPVTVQAVTSVIFCNFAFPGFLAQEALAVTFNSTTGPVIPSIGDQVVSVSLQLNQPTPAGDLLSSIALPEQYVVTAILVSILGVYNDPSIAPVQFAVNLSDSVTGAVLRQWQILALQDFTNASLSHMLCDETGLNIPVQSLVIQSLNNNALSSGTLSASITYAQVNL
jgi:hypothetical protein